MLNKIYNKSYEVLNKELLEANIKINMLLTDIPYNINVAKWDSNFKIKEYIDTVLPILEKDTVNFIGIWCHLEQTFELFKVMHDLNFQIHEIIIWRKTNSLSIIQEEHCYIFTTNANSIDVYNLLTEVNRSVYIEDRTHSCQKPLDILEYITNKYFKIIYEGVQKPFVFLDNFLGSSSSIVALMKHPLYYQQKVKFVGSELHKATYKKSLLTLNEEEGKANIKGIVATLEEELGYSKYTKKLYKDILEDLIKISVIEDKQHSVKYKEILYFYIMFNFNCYRYTLNEFLSHLSNEDQELATKVAEEMCLLESEGGLYSFKSKHFNLKTIECELDIKKTVILRVKPKILNGKKRVVSLKTRQNRYKSLMNNEDFQSRKDYSRKRDKRVREKGNKLLSKLEEELNLGIVSTQKEFLEKHNLSKSTFYYQTSKINNRIR